jgi:hypothetical protein
LLNGKGCAEIAPFVPVLFRFAVSLQRALVKKENICAPALAFVFAWHRIGAIAIYEKQR